MPLPFYVLILGSGSAIPKKNKNHSAQLVVYNGKHLLLDCGEGTQIQLKKYGASIQKIDHIFISHLHGDHYLGLPGLIATMNLLGRQKKLCIYGPEGLRKLIDLHFELASSRCNFHLEYQVLDARKAQLIMKSAQLDVYAIPLKHKIETTGFKVVAGPKGRKLIPEKLEKYEIPKHLRNGIKEGRDYVTEGGVTIPNSELTKDPEPTRSYAYFSDTAYREHYVEEIRNVNLLYHEATFLKEDVEKARNTLHSTAEQAGKMARQANAEKLIIGHFSNKYDDDYALLKEARKVFELTEIAQEGMQYEID